MWVLVYSGGSASVSVCLRDVAWQGRHINFNECACCGVADDEPDLGISGPWMRTSRRLRRRPPTSEPP